MTAQVAMWLVVAAVADTFAVIALCLWWSSNKGRR